MAVIIKSNKKKSITHFMLVTQNRLKDSLKVVFEDVQCFRGFNVLKNI